MPYAIARSVLRLPSHPLNQAAFPYWAADYWATLGTSGLFTAATAVLLVLWGRELGCSSRTACLIGLAYGLATPAYVYATLAYGHQASALPCSRRFSCSGSRNRPRDSFRLFLAGFLAAYAAVIEIQVGPVSAILGFYLLAQCLGGHRRPDALALFAVGAIFPTLILLTYNQLAFGSPWDMGYFHHATQRSPMSTTPTIPSACASPIDSGISSSPSSGDVIAGSRFTPQFCGSPFPVGSS